MKLSMSTLAWYLRDFDPVCHIEADALCIEGLRFVMDDVDTMKPEYLYFGNAEYFFTAPQYENAYLAVNRHSILIFMHSEYNELLNRLLSAFDFFNRWEASLLDAASRSAPLSEFVALAENVICNPMSVGNMDRSFQVATDISGHRTDPLWGKSVEGLTMDHPALYAPYYDAAGSRIHDLSGTPVLVRNVYEGGDPVMMMYLKNGEEPVGTLAILQEDASLTEQNFQLVPVFVRYCTKAADFTTDSGAIQSGSSIFQTLLDGRDAGELNLGRLKSFLPPPPWRLAAIRLNQRTDQLAIRSLIAQLRKQPCHHLPVQSGDLCCCILSDGDVTSLRQFPEISTGVSMPFFTLDTIPVRRQQAEFALSQGRGAPISLCEEHACAFLLGSFRNLDVTASLLHPALEQLEQYDRENQTELRASLSVYLYHNCNQLFSARAMHIHPNTMRYRLQRIMEITGLTLTDPEELKYLRLSDWLS